MMRAIIDDIRYHMPIILFDFKIMVKNLLNYFISKLRNMLNAFSFFNHLVLIIFSFNFLCFVNIQADVFNNLDENDRIRVTSSAKRNNSLKTDEDSKILLEIDEGKKSEKIDVKKPKQGDTPSDRKNIEKKSLIKDIKEKNNISKLDTKEQEALFSEGQCFAKLAVLDRITANSKKITLAQGGWASINNLSIKLNSCHYEEGIKYVEITVFAEASKLANDHGKRKDKAKGSEHSLMEEAAVEDYIESTSEESYARMMKNKFSIAEIDSPIRNRKSNIALIFHGWLVKNQPCFNFFLHERYEIFLDK